jgi:biopolymer transport protein ExbB/TolQ
MGTLIPMGPALMNITTGDIALMAGNLVIAFSTTVVGLMIGAFCLIMLVVRQQWYAKDMSDLDYLLQIFYSEQEKRYEEIYKDQEQKKTLSSVY